MEQKEKWSEYWFEFLALGVGVLSIIAMLISAVRGENAVAAACGAISVGLVVLATVRIEGREIQKALREK
jgi:hypothetical protein